MPPIIELKNLTKYYGQTCGIKDLNLTVQAGEIFGFLGPNGAGKTTAIRTMLNLLKASSGDSYIFGERVKRKNYPKILSEIGYLTSDLGLYENMTGAQMLAFTKSFYPEKKSTKLEKAIIDKLKCNLEMPYKKLSRGNKQKIGILLALFHMPRLLVLDEPTSGLDPLTRNWFYKILDYLKSKGTSIFFSSHDLYEVEKICDRIAIIKNGELVDIKTLEELRQYREKVVEIYFASEFNVVDFSQIEGVEIVEKKASYLQLHATSAAINPLLQALAKYQLKDINFAYPDLEKIFLKYYQK